LSTQNQNHDDYGNDTNNGANEDRKAAKAMEELQKKNVTLSSLM
jgi:hypothetical protein